MRLLILTGDHAATDPTKRGGQYNAEDMATHDAMVAAFRSFDDLAVEVMSDHSVFLDAMRESPPDLVVNFCDTGYRNIPTRELNIPAYLELLDIPYTGASPQAMVICFDKSIVRMVASELGVAVPREVFIGAEEEAEKADGVLPALLKPNAADGSVGITQKAVVDSMEEGGAYLAWMREVLPGCDTLWQEYFPGPEYGMGLIGNPETGLRALPALEVDFEGLPDGLPPILSYESKALPDSPYWTEIKFKRAESLGAGEEAALAENAKRLFARLGLRDYGRFDFRRDAEGRLKLMEVNPNPAWANDGKLAFMASFAGFEYRDMLRMIVDAACARVRAA